MRIIILGSPGSGKGTQAEYISEMLDIPHISTGNIFRHNIANGTSMGEKVKKYLDQGMLVPDELTNLVVRERLDGQDCEKGYVLDGFPRTLAQAQVLEAFLEEKNRTIDMVISLEVPDEVVISRMAGRKMCQCGSTYHVLRKPPREDGICDRCGCILYIRDDDRPETIRKRLESYHAATSPLVEFYRNKALLRQVDGTGLPHEVTELVRDLICSERTEA